jgi:Tol biopolymer transport system component
VLGADGTGVRRLSDDYSMFTWAPDGSRLAYSNGGHLTVVRADGSGERILLAGEGALDPTWSPDGSHIAFHRSGDGPYVIPADGSGVATLVDRDSHLVAWTPDGRLVVIVSPSSGPSDVVVYDQGSRRVLATDGLAIIQPAPSPDGALVAYQADRLRVVGFDGSGSRAATEACCGAESVGSPLRWSPDGRLLTYMDRGDIKVVGADGNGERVLAADGTDPDWSPDGRRLAFIGESDIRADGLRHGTLQLMAADGSGRHTVFDAGQTLGVTSLKWSPSGRQLAVVVVGGGLPL